MRGHPWTSFVLFGSRLGPYHVHIYIYECRVSLSLFDSQRWHQTIYSYSTTAVAANMPVDKRSSHGSTFSQAPTLVESRPNSTIRPSTPERRRGSSRSDQGNPAHTSVVSRPRYGPDGLSLRAAGPANLSQQTTAQTTFVPAMTPPVTLNSNACSSRSHTIVQPRVKLSKEKEERRMGVSDVASLIKELFVDEESHVCIPMTGESAKAEIGQEEGT